MLDQLMAPAIARARDGTGLSYTLREKAGSDRRIALVHSLAMGRDFWRPVAERLATHASVLTYDCRGHGASDKPNGPYTVELFADDLADLLAHVGWRSALVAGASMGGCVALAFAGRHGGRLDGLGLIDTTAWYGPDAPRQWAERADKALGEGLRSLVPFQQTRWFGERFRADHPDIVAECVAAFLDNDLPAYAATCRMLGAADLRGVLPEIRVPTIIAVGEHDYATPPAMAAALQAGIAGARMTVIADAHHLTPLEHPDIVADELRSLIEAVR